jgi:hypothetical protein
MMLLAAIRKNSSANMIRRRDPSPGRMSGKRKIQGKAVRRFNWLAIPRFVSVVVGIEAALRQSVGELCLQVTKRLPPASFRVSPANLGTKNYANSLLAMHDEERRISQDCDE